MDDIDDEVLSLLASIEGVLRAEPVPDELRRKLLKEEERYASLGPIPVDNRGVREAAERDRLYVIIKDRTFRPPPIPTVILTDDSGEVIGEEILPSREPSSENGERLIHLGRDFVIYYSRAKGRGRNSRFEMPPVPFPEVEGFDFARNVVSASPSTNGDMAVKNALDIEDDPKIASILIGFDIE